MNLKTENLHKTFGQHRALRGLNLEIASGELAALLGPSGCGKTTLLRIFAGLEHPDEGRVLIDGEDQTGIDVRRRHVGFVFQHYALFRHMTVFENVAFGLRVKRRAERLPEPEIRRRVHEILSLVQLDNQSDKYPDQMSGGQRQRVALARSLVVNPKILLLDEPFGALDANVRKDLRRWLRRLHDEIHVTTILVTHDQEEALEVADKIVLMNQGRLEQVGSPEDIYLRPSNAFVYEFLGSVNVFHGRIQGDKFVPAPGAPEGATKAYVRPHEFSVWRQRKEDSDREGVITRVSFAGPVVRLEVQASDDEGLLEAAVDMDTFHAEAFRQGDRVFLSAQKYKTFLGEGI